jgi:uncharacterized SAM-binding protein YcdF (DUF218 family)
MIRLILRWVLRIGLVLLAGLAVYLGVTAVQVFWTSVQYDPQDASAAIVMGAAQYDGVPSPDLRARLNEALSLWRKRYTSLIIVTGGRQPGDAYTESQAGARYLEYLGVPASDIVQADGNDSWANVADAAPEMRARHVSTLLVVTDPFHEDRSMAIASELGFHPYPTPTQHSPIQGWSEVPYFAKETVAVALGRVIGYQNLDSLPFGIR